MLAYVLETKLLISSGICARRFHVWKKPIDTPKSWNGLHDSAVQHGESTLFWYNNRRAEIRSQRARDRAGLITRCRVDQRAQIPNQTPGWFVSGESCGELSCFGTARIYDQPNFHSAGEFYDAKPRPYTPPRVTLNTHRSTLAPTVPFFPRYRGVTTCGD